MTYYEIHDTHGAPQCGCDIISFAEWYEVEEYLDENPDVMERIGEMYATIKELTGEFWSSDEIGGTFRTFDRERLARFYLESVDHDIYPTFKGWVWDMERSGTLTHHNPVEFVQMTPCDFDEYGAECYEVQWEHDSNTYVFKGVQERPITPTMCHIYDVSVVPAVYIGSIETDDDGQYLEILAQLVHRYTFEGR